MTPIEGVFAFVGALAFIALFISDIFLLLDALNRPSGGRR